MCVWNLLHLCMTIYRSKKPENKKIAAAITFFSAAITLSTSVNRTTRDVTSCAHLFSWDNLVEELGFQNWNQKACRIA